MLNGIYMIFLLYSIALASSSSLSASDFKIRVDSQVRRLDMTLRDVAKQQSEMIYRQAEQTD